MAENIRLSSAQTDTVRLQCERERDEAITARGDFPSRHAERYRRFLADPTLRPPGPWPSAAKLFISVTRSVLEKLQAEIWATLFGNEENLLLEPVSEEDVENALSATRFLRWSLKSLVDKDWFVPVSMTEIFDALLDSAAVSKVVAWSPPWELPVETARYFDRIVRIDPLDLETCLIPPDATGLQYPSARYVGHEMYLSADDIYRMKRQGYDIPDPDEMQETTEPLTERRQAEVEREGEQWQAYDQEKYLFVEHYTRFRLDTKSKFEEDVIVSWFPEASAADGTKSARGRLSRVRRLMDVYPQDDRPRRPFFETTIWPQPRQWRGMNVPDRLESMQDLVNRLHEQLVNYGEVSMLPYVFVNTFLTGELPDLRQVQPGSTVPIDDINGVQFAPTRSLNRHFAEQISMSMANIERDSAVSDFTQGRTPDRPNVPRTASATLALIGESRKTFGALARHAAIQQARKLSFYFKLWQTVLPQRFRAPIQSAGELREDQQDILFRLYGGDTSNRFVSTEVFKSQLSGQYDAVLTVDPDAVFTRQVLIALSQSTIPLIQDYPMGQRELMKRVYAAHNQRGFDQIWPESVASVNTQIQLLTKQVQLAALQQQLNAAAAARQRAQQQEAQQEQERAAITDALQSPANGSQAPVARSIIAALQDGLAAEQEGGG